MFTPKVERAGKELVPSQFWLCMGDWYNFPANQTWFSTTDYFSGELLLSEGHQVSRLGGTLEDIGGNFKVRKRFHTSSSTLGGGAKHFSAFADPMAHGDQHWYFEPRAAKEHIAYWSDAFEDPGCSSDIQLDAKGTTAISRIVPTNPVAGAAAFLGELREGLPKLAIQSWKPRAGRARAAGGDYLNATFGWKPLVSDIKKFAYVVKNADRITKQYEQGSGKLLKRRYDFPDEIKYDHDEHTGRGPVPNWDNRYLAPNHIGVLKHERHEKRRTWVEAAFTYYLPPVGTRARDLAIANKLYGIRPTPDVLWQLTPWSWAADWVTNLGDISSNVSAFMSDGLVMPYAYVMEETTIRHEWTLDQVAFTCYPGMHSFYQAFTSQVKVRRRATPYGFGFDMAGMTPRQGAILTALGIQRKR